MAHEASHEAGTISAPITKRFFAMAEANVESQTPTLAPVSSGSTVKMVLLVSAAVNVALLVALFVVKMRKQQQVLHEPYLGTPTFDDGLQTSSSPPASEGSSAVLAKKAAAGGATPMTMSVPVDKVVGVAFAPVIDVFDDDSDSDQDVYVRTSSTVSYIRFSGYPGSDESDSFYSSRHTDWRAYLHSSSSSLGSLSPFSSEGDVESPTTRTFETELTTPPLPPVTPPTIMEITQEVQAVEVSATTTASSGMPQLPSSVVALIRSVTVNRLLAFRTKRGMHASEPQAGYV